MWKPSWRRTTPALFLVVAAAQLILRFADLLSKGDALVNFFGHLPTWLRFLEHPVTGLLLLVVGILWLGYQSRPATAPSTILDSSGKVVTSHKAAALRIAGVSVLLGLVIAVVIAVVFRRATPMVREPTLSKAPVLKQQSEPPAPASPPPPVSKPRPAPPQIQKSAKQQPTIEPLKFSNSPILTDGIKERITQDIAGFRSYLIGLRLDAPSVVPPISIGSPGVFTKPLELTGPAGAEGKALFLPSGGRYESRIYPNRKPSADFNHNIVLLAPEVGERTAITSLYGMYALSQFIDRTEPDPDDFYSQARDLAITQGAIYFSSSFWNSKVRYSYIMEALWEVRGRLGQKFTDQLIAYTLRAFNESIYKSHKSDLVAYFYERLKEADDILDHCCPAKIYVHPITYVKSVG